MHTCNSLLDKMIGDDRKKRKKQKVKHNEEEEEAAAEVAEHNQVSKSLF
jgi:hypothetical protein